MNDEVTARYQVLRAEINSRYAIIDLLRPYIPNIQPRTTVCASIFNPADINPSMRLNLETNQWNDFSTGFKGGYLELAWRIRKEILKQDISCYSVANEMLINNKSIQEAIGARNLFKSTVEITSSISLSDNKPQRVCRDTFSSMLEKLNSLDKKDNLFDFISEYQMGMPERELVIKYSEILKNGVRGVRSLQEELDKILGVGK